MASFITLGLLALASATPVPSGGACHNNPAPTTSTGFKLRVSVANPAHDLTPKVNNNYLTGVHFGAGIDIVTPTPDASSGSVFYANGTDAEIKAGKGTVVRGFGNTAQGWRLETSPDKPGVAGAFLQFGPGTSGVGIVSGEKGGLMLGPAQYMVCDEHIPYGFTVEQTTGKVPDNCIAVTLIPECADLGGEAKGKTIPQSRCNKTA